MDYYAGLELAEPAEWGVHLVQLRTLRGPRPEEGEEADADQGIMKPLHTHTVNLSIRGRLRLLEGPLAWSRRCEDGVQMLGCKGNIQHLVKSSLNLERCGHPL